MHLRAERTIMKNSSWGIFMLLVGLPVWATAWIMLKEGWILLAIWLFLAPLIARGIYWLDMKEATGQLN